MNDSSLFYSLWGKFGQRENLRQHEVVKDLAHFYKLLLDSTKKVQDFYILDEGSVLVEYENDPDFVECASNGNIFIAVFTTCWARLHLYKVLDHVGEAALYYDTDSVIYKETESLTQTGPYLGELTSELDKMEYITEFVSTGPKSYAYETSLGKYVCKVKGCSLNYRNSQSLNFHAMKNLVLDNPEANIVTTYPHKITRDSKAMEIRSQPMTKKFRLVYTKRVVQPNLDTLPFGY